MINFKMEYPTHRCYVSTCKLCDICMFGAFKEKPHVPHGKVQWFGPHMFAVVPLVQPSRIVVTRSSHVYTVTESSHALDDNMLLRDYDGWYDHRIMVYVSTIMLDTNCSPSIVI